ncbi:hypothetical protein [Microseira wollei]|uniref:Uncharacterized protein n=1 Tax=Microseira wollei NIES-4236 TaxID=2530354 RepID=A0AAV3WJM8_9CYAN|nr:hypothetical protein [Microseira wollei]GET40389.1 hypothetical protein MiSe_51980 [Microseira wollei NIES-4236]
MKTTAISKQAKQPTNIIAKFNTPQLLKGGLYLSWGTSLLLLIATISGVQGQRHAIQTVGKDSAPSILTAIRIKDSLAGMDANVVNELLVKPGENPRAIQDYEERYQKFAERMVAVAENITYDGERKPIETLQLAIGVYIAKIQQARDFNASGNTNGVITAYREAAEIMDKTLLPAADELAKVNLEQLDKSYDTERFAAGRSLFFVIISGLLLMGTLVGIQLFLNYRMRRILNPMLLAASAIAFIFLGYTIQALLASSHHLKVAKEDSFKSLHLLRQSRAIAYSANADESRYLLDTTRAAIHEQAFFNKVDKIAKLPNNQTFETLATTVLKGEKVWGVTGLMADALNNITFEGEKNAAVATLNTFDSYFKLDKQIRQLQQSGKRDEAITLCTGYNQGQSNWAFEQFKAAHQKFLDVNQEQFDDAIAKGFKDVQNFEIIASVATASIALLTLFGLLPRIKEYEM